jgi:xylan 1,4-beta-xylosidase
MKWSLLKTFAAVCCAFAASAAEPHRLTVDFSAAQGEFRALHGINKGPLGANGLINVTAEQKELRVPFTRLHDCHHPNPDVVDVHVVFPNPDADPARPESYDFRSTDEYLAAVRATGAEMVFRLGESIEHQTVKRHVHPPRDPARWAAVCAGIVRHYNEGWAQGHRYGIRYWEIWNEPENRPVMWTGTDAQFLELYRVTARTLRAEFPNIKIGGPGFGYYGKLEGVEWKPSEFCAAFLEMCRREPVPLDFFSWHCYTDNPAELATRAHAIRRMLDARGFKTIESHLNEWNYLPDNSWNVVSRKIAGVARQRGIDRMMGAEGGAFLAASLIELQDAPVDVANFFHGETGIFGLFTEVGAPTPNYHAMLAFARLLETPRRVRATGGVTGKMSVATGLSTDGQRASVLIANLSGPADVRISLRSLPWKGETKIVARVVDEKRELDPLSGVNMAESQLILSLRPPAVMLLTLSPREAR